MSEGPWGGPNRIVFTPTAEEFDAAARLIVRRTPAQIFWALMLALIAAISIVFAPPLPQWTAFFLGAAVALLLLPLAYWLIVILIGGKLARRVNARRWEVDTAYTVTWTDQGITVETDRMAMRLPWSIYIRRRETDAMILLYHSAILCQFVPKRALDARQTAALRPMLDRIRPM